MHDSINQSADDGACPSDKPRRQTHRNDPHVAVNTALALAASQIPVDRRNAAMTKTEALSRIRSDYLALPGLKLTVAHAARLWELGEEVAFEILEDLTRAGLLVRREEMYARR